MERRRRKTRYAFAVFAALSLFLIIAVFANGCTTFRNFRNGFFGETAGADEVVKIGVFEPMSGPDSRPAAFEIRGIELAHSLYPTIGEKRVELIYEDNRSDIYAAEEAAAELVRRQPAVALGSYGSIYSLAAAPIFEEAELSAISITNGNSIVTASNPYYFSICFTDYYESVALAKYAYEGLGVYGVATLGEVGNQLQESLIKEFDEKLIAISENVKIVRAAESYPVGTSDFSEILLRIKRQGVQAIFLPAAKQEALPIIKQARELGITAVFLGTSNWDDEAFARDLGETENVAFPTAFDADTATTAVTDVFLEAYREAYGEDATPTSVEAMGFDAYLLAIKAIERAGEGASGEEIRDAIQHSSRFQGASGSITFDANGAPIKNVVIKGIKDGEISSLYTVEPNWVNLIDEER